MTSNQTTKHGMKRWARRLVYGLIALVWLLVMLVPILAFQLARRGEIRWGEEAGQQVRVFLLQEKDAEGIGLQVSRPQSDASACVTTTVRYFMWTGEGQNTEYCTCNDGTICQVE